MADIRVFYNDKTIVFTDLTSSSGSGPHGACSGADAVETVLSPGEGLPVAKLLQKLENSKCLFVKSADPAQAFERFERWFTPVDAAGGLVVNGGGDVLMIFRNGRWDLPKGHVEAGETYADTATREVEEETGLGGVEIVREITDTLHFYRMHGGWELKRTRWFLMRYGDRGEPQPQAEEGIEKVEWIPLSLTGDHVALSYSSIAEVFRTEGMI